MKALRAGDRFFASCGEFHSLIPGLAGVFLRRAFYVMSLDHCARDCYVEFGTWFAHPQACIGRGVYIGGRCTLGMCDIGEGTLIGSNVDILSGRHHHHFDDPDTPIQDQGATYTPVRIGRNCWIGNSSVIMADVGENSVIGAGSVVVKPIPPWSVAAGNPATVKRSRPPRAPSPETPSEV
jgi:acetyltransferase-like isoleucine patch superfamily enzyme